MIPLPRIAFAALTLAVAGTVSAPACAQVGLASLTLADGRMNASLFFPTDAPAQPRMLGPFPVHAAFGAAPTAGRHPLLVISHGTGGNELGHAWLAERMARQGWMVLAIRHIGDNYQDRSLIGTPVFFSARPRQVTRALDDLLADPRWGAVVDRERIAAFGHSAGGHTVLALAGGRPDRAQVLAHCGPGGIGLKEDAAMCALGDPSVGVAMPTAAAAAAARSATPSADTEALPDVRDPRIRAVVAAAPVAQSIHEPSIKAIAIPVHVETGGRDEILAPKWQGQWLCARLAQGSCFDTPGAGHFASFQIVGQRMGPPGLDPAEDPAGFDRAAWQQAAGARIERFLRESIR